MGPIGPFILAQNNHESNDVEINVRIDNHSQTIRGLARKPHVLQPWECQYFY